MTRKSIYCGGRKYQKETLMPVIVRKIKPNSWVYTDIYRSHDALDVSKFHHERINHSELFAVK
ncbi:MULTISPECIES: transposase [Haemophilus]|uniref:transposase n=1 Tax=Haemophilus TaxID=724 RepID=UPI0014288F66|nr:transposase [Haemophilus quentini]NYA47023.1 transposase [Haemophilus haemolyticus]